jgi:hypothetical protein
MDPIRFDTITRLFANRRTRRATTGGTLGLVAAVASGRALGQNATPDTATQATGPAGAHPEGIHARPDTEFLFAQAFTGGTWAPKEGENGAYTLALTGAAAQTVYFSDRPERLVGLLPNQEFFDKLGFTPETPPNAALVADTDGGQDILVIELRNPAYDASSASLTYDARVLADYGETDLSSLARRQADYDFPQSFSTGGLFIDDSPFDCKDISGECYNIIDGNVQIIGDLAIGACGADRLTCQPCDDDGTDAVYGKACAEKYPDQCNYYSNGVDGWDCYARGGGI